MELVQAPPSHIIAIGASAGGLEALESLFDALPDDLGCAFVVVQHLSPDFKSMMDELLKKQTNMPTHQATEGETLLADTVYLIPAGKLMRVTDGKIYLSELPPDNRINLPINEFSGLLQKIHKIKRLVLSYLELVQMAVEAFGH